MKNAFVAFLVVQFLNVQIQTAFATEGVSQFHAAETGSPVARIQSLLNERFQGMGHRAQMRLAYRLFKINIKLRNRVAGMNEEEFQQRLAGAPSEASRQSAEDQEIAAEMSEIDGVDAIAPELRDLESSGFGNSHPSQLSRDEVLRGADSLLISLGAKLSSTNRLEKVTFRDFKESLERDPGTVILKVVLSLLVLMLGLVVITVAFAFLFAYALAGVLVTGAWFYLVLFGTLIGMFFGIRAIIRASLDQGKSQGHLRLTPAYC